MSQKCQYFTSVPEDYAGSHTTFLCLSYLWCHPSNYYSRNWDLGRSKYNMSLIVTYPLRVAPSSFIVAALWREVLLIFSLLTPRSVVTNLSISIIRSLLYSLKGEWLWKGRQGEYNLSVSLTTPSHILTITFFLTDKGFLNKILYSNGIWLILL